MARPLVRADSPYRVVFSASASKAVGRMPQSAFQALQEAVDRIPLLDITPSPASSP